MSKTWITLAAFALLAGAAQAKEDAKVQPSATAPIATYKAPAAPPATATKKLVNLNAATAKELKGLPGGSDEEAARIIAGRPYNSKALLVTNKVISEGRYVEIKALVVAGEGSKPPAGTRNSSR